MGVTAIVLFILYFWGFGYATVKLLRAKEASSFLEQQLMRLGLGFGSLLITAMIFSAVNIPLDWRIFLVMALAMPAVYLARNYKTVAGNLQHLKLKLKKSDINILLVLLIFFGSLYMYASGAFSYPYLEDDDPWSHIEGVKYIALEKTFDVSEYRIFAYMNPYPPSYDFVFGLIHQTESSIYWTVKFFNAVLISLSLIFFYFFAAEFMANRNKALFATAVLAALPAYLSHFIWAPVLAMMTFFPALYALERIKHDKRWKWVAVIAIGGLILAHPTSTLTLFVLIIIYLFVKFLADKDWKSYSIAGFGGMATALSWWGFHGKEFIGGVVGAATQLGGPTLTTQGVSIFARLGNAFVKTFNKWSGTASRPYNFNDFMVAKGQNLINNPVGIGLVAMLLLLLGLVAVPIMSIKKLGKARLPVTGVVGAVFVYMAMFKASSMLAFIAIYTSIIIIVLFVTKAWKEKVWFFITLLWFLLTFTIVNNQTFDLPIGFFAFRTWMMMAVPIALIATEGLWVVFGLLPKLNLERNLRAAATLGIVILVLTGIWFSSGQQKYEVNTATWPPGVFWTSNEEIVTYLWLKNLPTDTRVWSFNTDGQIIAMDMYSCGWCEAEAKYRRTGINDTPAEMAAWLKANDYEYMIIGGMEIRRFGQNSTISKINEIAASGLFSSPFQNNGAIIFQVI